MNSSALYCGSGGGGAALRAAAGAGDAAACARLLGAVGNASVRFSRDELGRSALHLASSAGHAHVVRLLLNAAAHREVDSPDGAGCTPLQRAAADGHEDVIKLLLARGADVDKQDSVHGNSALHEASWKGYSRSVKILVLAGANLSKSNAGGFTALHLSCQNGHNQSCRELLLGGCDPDLQNNYGDTALHTAARYGHAGVTRILLSAQAKVAEQNKNGDTALHISSAMGRRKLTRILLENNCPKSIRNKQNETPEDIARRKDLREILTILTEVNGILGGGGFGRGGEAATSSRSREFMNKKSCCNKKDKERKRSKSKVRFENNNKNKDSVDGAGANKADGKNYNWSPYGCHYYPDPEAFPQPRLDSLPTEPLKKGEQYYSDLAGNIKKGPVGLGYTCYCAPLFRHLEARLEKDKRELQKAQVKLGQRLAGLEQRIGGRNAYGRRSERVISHTHNKDNNNSNMNSLSRSKSLEMLDANIGFNMSEIKVNGNTMMVMNKMGKAAKKTKSMDELKDDLEGDDANGNGSMPRRSVKEIVALLQAKGIKHNDSESSDEEDGPLIMAQHRGPMEDSNLIDAASGFEETGVIAPRSRIAMYSPTGLINTNQRFDGDAFRATSVSPLRDSCSASPRDSGILSREPPMSPPQTESPKSSQKSPPMITPSDWQKLRQDFNFNANHTKNENQQIKSPIAMATTTTTGTGTSRHHLNYFQYPDQAHFPHSSSQSNSQLIRQQQNNNNAIMYERNYADNMNARFAKLRMLDSTVKLMAENPSSSSYSLSPLPLQQSTSRMLDSKKMFDSTSRMLENVQHTILDRDRDTNNDSGYSTKVYGSSKGNSPSLSGQIDNNNELILNSAVSSSSSPCVVTAASFAATTMTTTKNTGNGAPGLSASSLV